MVAWPAIKASCFTLMESSTTHHIVASITKAIVEHRLPPGAKLVEQKLADHFEVSRTLVRQALFQLERDRLVRIEPARGAFVAAPSKEEAQQVFAVRRMLEAQMVREFAVLAKPVHIKALRKHIAQEQLALEEEDVPGRVELLGDFHVRIAELLDNEVLSTLLTDLIARCSLITLMYQSAAQAADSHAEHSQIVDALEAGDPVRAAACMLAHLEHVERPLVYEGDVTAQARGNTLAKVSKAATVADLHKVFL